MDEIVFAREDIGNSKLPRDNDNQLTAYAWPGGYPLFYIDKFASAICVKCARELDRMGEQYEKPIGYEVNWESNDLYCDVCSNKIDCAYCDKPNLADRLYDELIDMGDDYGK